MDNSITVKKNQETYVNETLVLVKHIESRFIELSERLYTIQNEKLWQSRYDSFNEFLEDAHITPGEASKLIKIFRTFVIENGVDHSKLSGIGYSKLYEVIPLVEKEGAEMAVTKASTLMRSEIQDEVRDKKYGVHDHVVGPERWGACSVCNKFIKM